jgi:serine/threonine-protein kinase
MEAYLMPANTLRTNSILQQRYRVMRLLGQGGFGAVYQAQDMRLGNRFVAVKENFDASPEAQRQFAREAQMLANLNHANLPRVTDHFIEPSGKQYLVMDFIEGRDVEEILKEQGVLQESQALRWFNQICDALEYLHRQNPPVIHRDIKPSNIRITPQGTVMLVDFGIAKQEQEGNQTIAAARAVTAGFSPPEQYGRGGTDARSDIYALGATLYHMLTGVMPPEATERISGHQFIAPRQINSQISPGIERVIQQSLELAPRKRPQSISQLRQLLNSDPWGYRPSSNSPSGGVRLDKQAAPSYPLKETPVYPSTPVQEPYRIPVAPVYQSAPIQQQYAPIGRVVGRASAPLANPVQRLVASVIDSFLILMIMGAFISVEEGLGGHAAGLATCLSLFLYLGYFTYFHAQSGQTPGKKLLGIKVVSEDGSPISMGQAIGRTFGYWLSAVIGYLGYLLILVDRDKQGLHDKLAKTVVIQE